MARCIVVTGRPNSGKSTYVRELAEPLDLVWDFDKIVRAITNSDADLRHEPLPRDVVELANELRFAFVSFVFRIGPTLGRNVWVIVTNPVDAECVAGTLDAEIVRL